MKAHSNSGLAVIPQAPVEDEDQDVDDLINKLMSNDINDDEDDDMFEGAKRAPNASNEDIDINRLTKLEEFCGVKSDDHGGNKGRD
jgi:hypothetical protein